MNGSVPMFRFILHLDPRWRIGWLALIAILAFLVGPLLQQSTDARLEALRDLRIREQLLSQQAVRLSSTDAATRLAALGESRNALRVRLLDALTGLRELPTTRELRHRLDERAMVIDGLSVSGTATLRLTLEGRITDSRALLEMLQHIRQSSFPWPSETRACVVQDVTARIADGVPSRPAKARGGVIDQLAETTELAIECAVDIMHREIDDRPVETIDPRQLATDPGVVDSSARGWPAGTRLFGAMNDVSAALPHAAATFVAAAVPGEGVAADAHVNADASTGVDSGTRARAELDEAALPVHDGRMRSWRRHVFHGVVGAGYRLHVLIDRQLCRLVSVDADKHAVSDVHCDDSRGRLQALGYDAVQRRLIVRARDGASRRLAAGESWQP